MAHQSLVSLKPLVQQALAWQNETFKSQHVVQHAFNNLSASFFKAPNRLVRDKIIDLLLLVGNSKNVVLSVAAQKQLAALIKSKTIAGPKETAAGTGASL